MTVFVDKAFYREKVGWGQRRRDSKGRHSEEVATCKPKKELP